MGTILPLLEFALTKLWEQREDGRLTHEGYKKTGGTAGSLTQWADRIYYELMDSLNKYHTIGQWQSENLL